jgi:hypothetical protein
LPIALNPYVLISDRASYPPLRRAGARRSGLVILGSMLHGPGRQAQQPQPWLWSGGADVVRASKLRHAVERVDADAHLGHATVIGARAQRVHDHLLEPANCCLGSCSRRVAGRPLPSHAVVLGDVRRTPL